MNSTIVDIIAVLFTILFLYTGISKLSDYSIFKEQIATSSLLSPIAGIISIIVPWTEFLVVVLLIVPRWRLNGLIACLILMIAFTGYIIAILLFNKHIPCSCGGILEQLSWKAHLYFNSAFTILALIGILLEKKMNRESRIKLASILKTE